MILRAYHRIVVMYHTMCFSPAGTEYNARAVGIKRKTLDARLNSCSDRGKHSFYDVPTDEELLRLSQYFHDQGNLNGLQFRMEMLMAVHMLLRSEDTRNMELSFLFTHSFQNQGMISV